MGSAISLTAPILRAHGENREKGFVIAGSLLVITLTLTALTSIAFFQHVTYGQLKTKSACLDTSLDYQKKMAKLLDKLLGMNPRALSLRRQLKAAQVRLKHAIATATPPVIAAAEAHLLLIETQRLALNAKQKIILGQAQAETIAFQMRLKSAITRSLNSRVRIETFATGLAVDADLPLDIAPQYFLRTNFSNEQKSGAIWNAPFASYIRATRFFKDQTLVNLPLNKRWENSCAATLEERRPRQFFVSMTAAKSSSKFTF